MTTLKTTATTRRTTTSAPPTPHSHQYSTRHSMASQGPKSAAADSPMAITPPDDHSTPIATDPKMVAFELLFPEAPECRARLPMRVNIYPHDTTDSILSTVKNFYGLYDAPGGAKGVSFEDEDGNILIARYENFLDGMSVYVRVVLEPTLAYGASPYGSPSPPGFPQGHPNTRAAHRAADLLQAHALTSDRSLSRPTSRATDHERTSPHPERGRADSVGTGPVLSKKGGASAAGKGRASSAHGDQPGDGGPTSQESDGGPLSGTGSRRAKAEPLASAEISLDNIVEGGRRKRAKFDSSELPLFVPPQVPLAASAVGPLIGHRRPPLSAATDPHGFAYPYSPLGQSHGGAVLGPAVPGGAVAAAGAARGHGHHLRSRPQPASAPSPYLRGATTSSYPPGILPTPDPTVASCISDEDVAIQLMRLGDASNISNGTRHSASTVDDALSGVADVASSTGATSDDDSEATDRAGLPAPTRHQLESSPIPLPGVIKRPHKHLDEILPSFDSTEPSGDEDARTKVDRAAAFSDCDGDSLMGVPTAGTQAEDDDDDDDGRLPNAGFLPPPSTSRTVTSTGAAKGSKTARPRVTGALKGRGKGKANKGKTTPKAPMSPASLPPPLHSRKPSTASTLNFQHNLREDEEDLSSKPRCQRCRKSKKGCDRQRPCHRCKDAGIGIDGCISEDETNGRKGRFGRHMGVTVKKGTTLPLPFPLPPSFSGPVELTDAQADAHMAAVALAAVPYTGAVLEKGKKRKR
ncbi:MAG: hypothetical protein M1826_004200 [Phylliscum demangeonii]|nr:MAG: hypothetical protein M1826_004200 [Phylliscum demangeonii]